MYKWLFLLIAYSFPVTLVCQAVIEGKWKTEVGASTITTFNKSSAINLRYISPRFRWSDDDLTEEQEKHAAEFKRTRLMFELLYTPPMRDLCMGVNVQYRLYKYKIVTLEAYGGLKFFFVRGPEFAARHAFIKGSSHGVWYINGGFILQFNFAVAAPFADIGIDGIMTLGTELNMHSIFRNPKRRYKLHARPTDK